MSHISRIELEVKDLGALQNACRRLGFQFMTGKKTFKWYGTEEASCDHAIKLPEASYEIGVVKSDGRYELQCDYYDPILKSKIGENGGYLKQAYAVEKTKAEARLKGHTVIERQTENGIRLYVRVGG